MMDKDYSIFENKILIELGFETQLGIEYEFYIQNARSRMKYTDLICKNNINELVFKTIGRIAEKYNGLLKKENEGQLELVIFHDKPKIVLNNFKFCIVEIDNYLNTFSFEMLTLAKPFYDRPGSSMQINISLHNQLSKKSCFYIDEKGLSKTLSYAIGGLCYFMIEDFVTFAPTIKSYLRFYSEDATSNHTPLYDSFVPKFVSWGVNSRSTALRIIHKNKGSAYVEHRVSGSDADIDKVFYVIFKSIYLGIQDKILPPRKSQISKYDFTNFSLIPFPKSLFGARKSRWEKSPNNGYDDHAPSSHGA